MKAYFKITALLLFSIGVQSCTNKETPKLQVSNFDGQKELTEIDNSIRNKTLDSITGDGYKYWYKQGKVLKLHLEIGNGGYGTDFVGAENYYLNENGNVFAYQKAENNLKDNKLYRALIFFNGENIVEENYWVDNVKKARKEMEAILKSHYHSINDIINDYQTKNSKGLLTISNLSKEFSIEVSSEIMDKNIQMKEASGSLKSFKELQLTLMDGSLKKAVLYLGEPDKEEHGFGHVTKGYAVYFNKVADNGKAKHLVLFLRMNGNYWGRDAKIEEVYSVSDGEDACFGIHCLSIVDGKIITK